MLHPNLKESIRIYLHGAGDYGENPGEDEGLIKVAVYLLKQVLKEEE